VFTQCSKCETIFKLSADVLRAAGGQVRCGKCGEVFNALAHLAEDSSAFTSGESAFDLETRADRILESVVKTPPRSAPRPSEDYAPPGVEIARLQILEWNGEELSQGAEAAPPEEEASGAVGETSMEFTLPPGELDRIFVESKSGKRPVVAPPPVVAPEPPPHPEHVAMFKPPPAPVPSGFEVPENVRRDMLSGLEPELEPELAQDLVPLSAPSRTAQPALAAWLLAAVAAALLLVGQIVHQNREWLSAHAPFGATLSALYARFGAPVPSPANLSAYQLRQWGVTGDPAADGTLRVRASILNTAAQLEPYPLLRVTLANRFGSSIGTRDFEASEYLGKPIARLLAPGERVDATMDILDPGKSAEGFEIDVCLRGADRKVSCANDAAAAQAKR
jgi:predicted Zn finger-like uncharacterized protein